MNDRRYIWLAAAAISLAVLSYVWNFYYVLDYRVSKDSAVWGQLGDYLGGLLNPVLTFISIVLLIKSLSLQNQANLSLRNDLKNSERTEKLRSFEALFFNMLDSQKEMFRSLELVFDGEHGPLSCRGVDAALALESAVEDVRTASSDTRAVRDFIEGQDSRDQIFSLTRAFYVSVKLIAQKLDDSEGFTKADRDSHYQTLINFTDFAQLRLIVMCAQFMDYPSVTYLRGNEEFSQVLQDVGLHYELY